MRKTALAAIAVLTAFTLAGCSAQAASTAGSDAKGADEPATVQEKPKPADLTGDWIQENAGDSSQSATVTADTITVNWVSTKDDTTAIYWAGTYQAPTDAGNFTWTSTRDKETTDKALLASTDATKDFAYADGKISYKVTAMDVTKTVTLVKK
ncbi:hypothetical protein SAMN04488591_2572 [Microbacterium azadirachtae]|uniref:Lipoprotein n=1 Tax=Microbacterium azadirachtae TaxID=582680 RepID=A0A1I6I8F0_9MICO|nr:hypothetical protein [Microbacterium azadirachtae]SFR62996.1 hypothetical protein SAMN04488591_2572 [Microbacterium azadirachtae]